MYVCKNGDVKNGDVRMYVKMETYVLTYVDTY